LISAYAVPANDGRLMKPYLLEMVYGADQRIHQKNEPSEIRAVISKEAAELITDVLLGAVKNGTGKEAFLENVPIAGKTGTAQLYDIEKGTFDSNKHLASFVGYFPARNPRYALLIMIRHPKGNYYGGLVAAPVFRKIVQRIMNMSSVPEFPIAENSNQSTKKGWLNIPEVTGFSRDNAVETLKKKGLKVRLAGDGDKVIRQENLVEFEKVTGVVLYLENKIHYAERVMPAITGLSLKEALNLLSQSQIPYEVQGSGIVIQQLPKAGSRIENGNPVKIVCKPS
jgi:membrane peptidoglycan carboxypeptidase